MVLVLLYTALVDYTPFVWLGAISVGLSSGASGIVTAHELGHRRPRSLSWWLSRLDLMCVLYLHFTVEHNHTHHKHWARPRDPTSSPWGRNVYYHFIRTIPLQIKGAYNAKPKDVKVSMIVQGDYAADYANNLTNSIGGILTSSLCCNISTRVRQLPTASRIG